ncbi:hypothetical protein ACQP00_20500 [Dactylosporangium sp. CS-047395]|uniref:hypothetical protein n=1 Tax=Dactylosporangium sp. CS-047395 TaxID=3239936 RepID=UPI003D8F605E
MTAVVCDAASTRSATSGALVLVKRGAEIAPAAAVDPRHARAVPHELAPVLGAGLRRGSVVAVAGSGSLLLSLIGAAQAAGAWAAIVETDTSARQRQSSMPLKSND